MSSDTERLKEIKEHLEVTSPPGANHHYDLNFLLDLVERLEKQKEGHRLNAEWLSKCEKEKATKIQSLEEVVEKAKDLTKHAQKDGKLTGTSFIIQSDYVNNLRKAIEDLDEKEK